jgi:hypothetical protein
MTCDTNATKINFKNMWSWNNREEVHACDDEKNYPLLLTLFYIDTFQENNDSEVFNPNSDELSMQFFLGTGTSEERGILHEHARGTFFRLLLPLSGRNNQLASSPAIVCLTVMLRPSLLLYSPSPSRS